MGYMLIDLVDRIVVGGELALQMLPYFTDLAGPVIDKNLKPFIDRFVGYA
jgi:hypothetical protein